MYCTTSTLFFAIAFYHYELACSADALSPVRLLNGFLDTPFSIFPSYFDKEESRSSRKIQMLSLARKLAVGIINLMLKHNYVKI
jgi:hypothetical protein